MQTHTPWKQLIELLETEIRLYKALDNLIEAESKALMQSDLTVFNQALRDKQRLVEALQSKEAARTAWLQTHGESDGKPQLRGLIARAPQEVAQRLAECRRELVGLTHAIDARNRLHSRMLNHSRNLADNALRLLGNQLYVQPTYQSNGNLSGAGKGGFVLSGLA